MTQVNRSALMPYDAQFMFQIVNDVAVYPEFLPWCGGVKIHQQDEHLMEASIQMKMTGLDHWFRTRNNIVPGQSIEMSLLDGPFESLDGKWQFSAIGEDGCKIELLLNFEVKQGLAARILKPAFSRIANTMVDSFCERARIIHERQTSD